jgi:hypothetical protein
MTIIHGFASFNMTAPLRQSRSTNGDAGAKKQIIADG